MRSVEATSEDGISPVTILQKTQSDTQTTLTAPIGTVTPVDDQAGGGLEDLERWAAESRAREAADARVRERWLRTQAEEGGRLTSVLAGLAEQEADVVVTTVGGRAVGGRVSGVGSDFVALVSPPGRTTLVALGAVAWVRPGPQAGGGRRHGRASPAMGPDGEPPEGDDPGPSGAGLADVLAQAVADRPRVAVCAANASLTGELRAAGVDLLVIEPMGAPAALAYVRLDSIYEISFLDSG